MPQYGLFIIGEIRKLQSAGIARLNEKNLTVQ